MKAKENRLKLVLVAIVLVMALSIPYSVMDASSSIALASSTDGPTAEQRDTIIEIAEAYASHTWTPTDANIWDVKVRGNLLDTPDWEPGQVVTGVPYKWGGFSSLKPFVVSSRDDFDEQIVAGFSAGDIPESNRDRTHEYAAGVDCSGFVSRAWQLSTKHGSWGLRDLSDGEIAFESVLRGDLIYKTGHVMLVGEDFDSTRDPAAILVYEASGVDWKVSARLYTVQELTAAGYKAYACPSSVFETPAQNNRIRGLYAGASNPGVVYEYEQPATWDATTLFSVSYRDKNRNLVSHEATLNLGYAVLSLVEYQGFLYAGTRKTSGWYDIGRVYRLHTYRDGSAAWLLVGDDLDQQVSSLVVYNGELYAGTSWGAGRLYECDGTFDWSRAVDHRYPGGWSGFRSAYVWTDGWLYLGDIGWDIIGRYNGTSFQHITHLGGSCIWDFASHDGALYASAYYGRLFRSSDGVNWDEVIDWGLGAHMWELEVLGDSLYMALGDGRLQRYAGTYDGVTIIEEIWREPDSNGIISMVAGPQNKLFLGVGGEAGYSSSMTGNGRVYSYDGKKAPQRVGTQELGTGVQVLYNTG